MNLANVFQLGVKELRGLLRDPAMLVLIVYSFTLSIYTESNALPDTLSNATISIVDEDRSTLSNRIASAFYLPYFVPPDLITITEMDARMDRGQDTFALDIPPDFARDVLAGNVPQIQLNVDATRMSQAFTGAGYIQQIVTNEVSEYVDRVRSTPRMPVDLVLRARFNPEMNASWFGAVNSVIMSITMLSIILTGAALIREKEHGTVEHLLVMPVSAAEIMLSKIWSMGAVVLLASAVGITFVLQGALQIPIAGSLGLFFLGAVLMLFATTALGIFLATVAGSMPQFGLLLILVLLPLNILSGGLTPRESMPEAIQAIMLLAPNTHFIILSQAIMFRGAGLEVVWPQFLALLLIGTVLFWLAYLQFRKFLR
ncbi:ABC transporter permease [Chachezhania sediminis]|uniref:ABC transporter permease n=1 Tax=Chachezhania sediminis TaxID=2599291 RepID=UPI00131C692F|nr:ABC transporter permease [Chachezhania sediminis]